MDKGDFIFQLASSGAAEVEPVPFKPPISHGSEKLRNETPNSYGETSIDLIGVGIKEASNGVQIIRVLPKGPAGEAGIMTNDIIIELNGEKIKSAQQFEMTIRDFHAGEMVSLKILRNGGTWFFRINIANRPTTPEQKPNQSSEKPINETPKAVARDGKYIAYSNGTIKDTRTRV